jgi:hypothetical protein
MRARGDVLDGPLSVDLAVLGGGLTYPQIIGGRVVDGFSELRELDRDGRLVSPAREQRRGKIEMTWDWAPMEASERIQRVDEAGGRAPEARR